MLRKMQVQKSNITSADWLPHEQGNFWPVSLHTVLINLSAWTLCPILLTVILHPKQRNMAEKVRVETLLI